MKPHSLILILLALGLAGCTSVAVEGANAVKDKAVVNKNIELAKQGDPVAQYKVGDALCCSPAEEKGAFYNTREAVSWLCASAKQGHVPAMSMIGKIYSGDTVDGVRVLKRAITTAAGVSTNKAIAYGWLHKAGELGSEDAASRARSVWEELNRDEKIDAIVARDAGLDNKCLWDEVIKNPVKA